MHWGDHQLLKLILDQFAILLDGKYRENLLNGDVYNYIDYYVRSSGKGKY